MKATSKQIDYMAALVSQITGKRVRFASEIADSGLVDLSRGQMTRLTAATASVIIDELKARLAS